MTAVLIRIALRYVAAFLVARGALSAEVGDTLSADGDIAQMLELALGSMVGVAAEVWLYAERKFAGAK